MAANRASKPLCGQDLSFACPCCSGTLKVELTRMVILIIDLARAVILTVNIAVVITIQTVGITAIVTILIVGIAIVVTILTIDHAHRMKGGTRPCKDVDTDGPSIDDLRNNRCVAGNLMARETATTPAL